MVSNTNPFLIYDRLTDEELIEKHNKTNELEKTKIFKLLLNRWKSKIKTHISNERSKFKHIKSVEDCDLFQIITTAFQEAVKQYDPTAETKFVTYAWTSIKNSVNRVIQGFQTGKREMDMEGVVCIDEVSNILTSTIDIEQQFFSRNIIREIRVYLKTPIKLDFPEQAIYELKDVIRNSFPVCHEVEDTIPAAIRAMAKHKAPMSWGEICREIETLQGEALSYKLKKEMYKHFEGTINEGSLTVYIQRCLDNKGVWDKRWYLTEAGYIENKELKKNPYPTYTKRIARKYKIAHKIIEKAIPIIREDLNKELFLKMMTIIAEGGSVRKELTRMYGFEVDDAMDCMTKMAERVLKKKGVDRTEALETWKVL